GQGYDFNPDTGQLIRNGLILVNSTPADAGVFINDKPESDLTPASFPVPDGDYGIRISREGYRDWLKTVSVTGSEVEWLYYPLLLPNELTTNNLTVFLRPEFVGVSPSGDNLLVRQASNEPEFDLISYSTAGVSDEESLTLPDELLELGEGKLGDFAFEGWASNNRHVLLTHSVGSRTEYIWLDLEDVSLSRNLTEDFDLNLREVRFIDGDAQQLYAIVTSDLRRINLENDTISTPIVRDLGRYVLHQDRFVVFVRNEGKASQLGLIENDEEPQILQELGQPASNYRLEFAEFDNVFYLSLLDLSAGQMSLITNPNLVELGTSFTPLAFNQAGTKYISFSRNGQFITMQAGDKFLTYDLDRKRRSSFEIDFKIGANDEAIWLDGYRLALADNKSLLHMFEFDGANEADLLKSNSSLSPIYSSGQNVLYSFTPPAEGGRVFLQGTPFTIPEN
ncbi:MAG TPA: PEGA domain-containing protein, partial [Candidatus Saccharimonadales bacterium]